MIPETTAAAAREVRYRDPKTGQVFATPPGVAEDHRAALLVVLRGLVLALGDYAWTTGGAFRLLAPEAHAEDVLTLVGYAGAPWRVDYRVLETRRVEADGEVCTFRRYRPGLALPLTQAVSAASRPR